MWWKIASSVLEAFSIFGGAAPEPPKLGGVQAELISIDRGSKKLLEKIQGLHGSCVDIGFLSSAGVHPESGMNMASHAAELVFGDPNINLPSRDFMTTVFQAFKPEVLAATRAAAELVIATRTQVATAMRMLGGQYVLFMKNRITTGAWEPLTPKTIEAKLARGSSHAYDILIDTEAMYDAIDFEVRRAL